MLSWNKPTDNAKGDNSTPGNKPEGSAMVDNVVLLTNLSDVHVQDFFNDAKKKSVDIKDQNVQNETNYPTEIVESCPPNYPSKPRKVTVLQLVVNSNPAKKTSDSTKSTTPPFNLKNLSEAAQKYYGDFFFPPKPPPPKPPPVFINRYFIDDLADGKGGNCYTNITSTNTTSTNNTASSTTTDDPAEMNKVTNSVDSPKEVEVSQNREDPGEIKSTTSSVTSEKQDEEVEDFNEPSKKPVMIMLLKGKRKKGGSSKDDKAQGRQRMRPWLEELLRTDEIPGLCWLDQSENVFTIPWKHASGRTWKQQEDASLFERYAVHTGKYAWGDKPDPKRWKANFRCALNSLPDVQELVEHSKKTGEKAFKIYKFLDQPVKKSPRAKRRVSESSDEEAVDADEEQGTEADRPDGDHTYSYGGTNSTSPSVLIDSETMRRLLQNVPLDDLANVTTESVKSEPSVYVPDPEIPDVDPSPENDGAVVAQPITQQQSRTSVDEAIDAVVEQSTGALFMDQCHHHGIKSELMIDGYNSQDVCNIMDVDSNSDIRTSPAESLLNLSHRLHSQRMESTVAAMSEDARAVEEFNMAASILLDLSRAKFNSSNKSFGFNSSDNAMDVDLNAEAATVQLMSTKSEKDKQVTPLNLAHLGLCRKPRPKKERSRSKTRKSCQMWVESTSKHSPTANKEGKTVPCPLDLRIKAEPIDEEYDLALQLSRSELPERNKLNDVTTTKTEPINEKYDFAQQPSTSELVAWNEVNTATTTASIPQTEAFFRSRDTIDTTDSDNEEDMMPDLVPLPAHSFKLPREARGQECELDPDLDRDLAQPLDLSVKVNNLVLHDDSSQNHVCTSQHLFSGVCVSPGERDIADDAISKMAAVGAYLISEHAATSSDPSQPLDLHVRKSPTPQAAHRNCRPSSSLKAACNRPPLNASEKKPGFKAQHTAAETAMLPLDLSQIKTEPADELEAMPGDLFHAPGDPFHDAAMETDSSHSFVSSTSNMDAETKPSTSKVFSMLVPPLKLAPIEGATSYLLKEENMEAQDLSAKSSSSTTPPVPVTLYHVNRLKRPLEEMPVDDQQSPSSVAEDRNITMHISMSASPFRSGPSMVKKVLPPGKKASQYVMCLDCKKYFVSLEALQWHPCVLTSRDKPTSSSRKRGKFVEGIVDMPTSSSSKMGKFVQGFVDKPDMRSTKLSNEHGYQCTVCKKTFAEESGDEFLDHIRKCSICLHFCSVCGKSFLQKKLLEEHMHKFHLFAFKLFQCAVCNMKFAKSEELQKHIPVHMDNLLLSNLMVEQSEEKSVREEQNAPQQQQQQEVTQEDQASDILKCMKCKAGFSDQEQLLAHVRVSHSNLSVLVSALEQDTNNMALMK